MEPITALLLLWLVSQATNSGPQTGPDAVKNIRDKGQDVKLLASKTSANAGFAEEIYYSNQGGNVGLYVVWPSNDAASFVVVSVDAAAATRLVTSMRKAIFCPCGWFLLVQARRCRIDSAP